ncbi:Aste57867_10246 [Aphanomyces stellatus]|uniref:Aste57867_10246 protein n=1 Tax=Aphanomyces stellatus TaxID=120398 RepID=A0A485KQN0_9STRA|nr:hypothetical protein As57867_010207 [Aphanomyces stellatus]VFT87121.1 Aste57867_10246 [Aphanomyces stellatus]
MAKKGKHAKAQQSSSDATASPSSTTKSPPPASATKSPPPSMGNAATPPVALKTADPATNSPAKSTGSSTSKGKSASYPTTPISTSKAASTSPTTRDIPKAAQAATAEAKGVEDEDIGDGTVASLAPKIERRLSTRPDVKELDEQDIMHSTTVAPTIQGTAKQLQRQLSADHVSTLLNKRPSFVELADQGIVSDKVAPTLQATSDTLKRQITADRLTKHINRRPSLKELAEQGVVDDVNPVVAPALIATAKKLERTMVQNQVGQLLETRPGLHDLISQQIFTESPDVANSLQGPMQSLARHLKADELSRKLKTRKTFTELFPTRKTRSQSIDENSRHRARYTVALKAASRIAADKLISLKEKGRLKDLILADDDRVVAAIATYEADRDVEEMLDTLYRIAKDKRHF